MLPLGRMAGLRVVTILSTYLINSSFAVSAPSAEATIYSIATVYFAVRFVRVLFEGSIYFFGSLETSTTVG